MKFLIFLIMIISADLFADEKDIFLGDREIEYYSDGIPKPIIINSNKPAPGYYYVATHNIGANWLYDFEGTKPLIMIFDNYGTSVFHKIPEYDENSFCSEFKILQDSLYVYYNTHFGKFFLMDEYFHPIDTLGMDGFYTDMHGIQMDENGHTFYMAYPGMIYDLSEDYPFAKEEITLLGAHVQEKDADGNVVFDWSSFDHMEVKDLPDYTAANITENTSLLDMCHINTIDVVSDTSLLLSMRNLNELTWIDRRDGEILYRMGLSKANEFEFISEVDGEPAMFYQQHDCRMLNDTILSVFDNGTASGIDLSRVCIYDVDFENKTVTLIKVYRNDPDIFGIIMGNAQTLPNGNVLAGWGSGTPGITEFSPEGNIESLVWLHGHNYRAYKFNRMPKMITANKDQLEFHRKEALEEVTQEVLIKNNYNSSISINEVHFNTNDFEIINELPVEIAFGEEFSFTIRFKGKEVGEYKDVATFIYDSLSQRLATQVELIGQADVLSISSEYQNFSIDPNPVNEKIRFALNTMFDQNFEYQIISIEGNVVRSANIGFYQFGLNQFLINDLNISPGMYILILKGDKEIYRAKFIKN